MRQRMCKACLNWHDLDEPWPCPPRWRKWSAPNVISDHMEPAKHHATGKMISSKREFSRETKAAGCIELGNEPIQVRKPIPLDKGARREAIKRTIYELRNGRHG